MTIPVTGVSELVLEVRDLTTAEEFYAGVLGLPVVERWPDREAIWVLAGQRTRIGLWRPQVGLAGGRGGAHVHFAFHLADADFDGVVERLRACGAAPHVVSHRRRGCATSRSVYVDDPDGNCVELWTRDVGRPGMHLDAEPEAVGHFDASADRWDREYDEPTLRGHWWRARLDAVLALAGDGPGRLLEVGLGSGRLLAALEQRGWQVTGADAAPAMVRLARERLSGAADVRVARAEELPFPSASFDVVVGVGVLEYTRLEQALVELARVLRPGGRAVVALRNGSAPTVLWHRGVVLPVARRLKRRVPLRPLAPAGAPPAPAQEPRGGAPLPRRAPRRSRRAGGLRQSSPTPSTSSPPRLRTRLRGQRRGRRSCAGCSGPSGCSSPFHRT